MQETRDLQKVLLDSAEKAGIFERKQNHPLKSGNQYYQNYIKPTNKEKYEKNYEAKSQRESVYLPFEEFLNVDDQKRQRIQYYIDALPEELDFKLSPNGVIDIPNIVRFNDVLKSKSKPSEDSKMATPKILVKEATDLNNDRGEQS